MVDPKFLIKIPVNEELDLVTDEDKIFLRLRKRILESYEKMLLSRPSSWRFGISLVWVPGHSSIPRNFMADEISRAGVYLPESSSIDLGNLPRLSWRFCR